MGQWWKTGVAYQIYTQSFMDSNNDGIGDINGIRSRLGYFKSLGVNILVLGPVNPSPMHDNGYDISNYLKIMDIYGTMEDFESLLREAHEHGMYIIMDMVFNHTSDKHEWFIESSKSRDNPKRDWYIWRDGKNGKEPNNWESVFSGSVWSYFKNTKQYVLHLYSENQIDLNWENSDVRQAVYKTCKLWLDKGVDGFRLDTITTISKYTDFPDAPITNAGRPYQPATQYYINGPRIKEYLDEFKREVFDKYDNTFVIAEANGVPAEKALLYVDKDYGIANVAFQWEHIESDPGTGKKWDEDTWTPLHFKQVMTKWQKALENRGWNVNYMSSHDQPRIVSRFGDESHYYKESAKMLATSFHMLRGTPWVFQGEEIGMTNIKFDKIEDYRCVETINMYHDGISAGEKPEVLMEKIHRKSRDNSRTPMQWDDSENAGFSKGTPWINVNPNYRKINVAEQQKDEQSILHYYQSLIALRKEYPVVIWGDFTLLLPEDDSIFAYTRQYKGDTLLVLCNFHGEERMLLSDALQGLEGGELLLSNYVDAPLSFGNTTLRPYEARIYHFKPD